MKSHDTVWSHYCNGGFMSRQFLRMTFVGLSLLFAGSAFSVEKPKPTPAKQVQKSESINAKLEDLQKSVQKLAVEAQSEAAQKSDTVRENLRRELAESTARLNEISKNIETSSETNKTAKNAKESVRDLGDRIAKLGNTLAKQIQAPANQTKPADSDEDFPADEDFPDLED